MQNGRLKDVLFVDGLKTMRITKLSSVTGVSVIVDLYLVVVELFWMIHFLFQIY